MNPRSHGADQLPRDHRHGHRRGERLLKFVLKGGPIYCFLLAAKYTRKAFAEINVAFTEKQIESPAPPVSCASMLTEKRGASELHTFMAVGFVAAQR